MVLGRGVKPLKYTILCKNMPEHTPHNRKNHPPDAEWEAAWIKECEDRIAAGPRPWRTPISTR